MHREKEAQDAAAQQEREGRGPQRRRPAQKAQHAAQRTHARRHDHARMFARRRGGIEHEVRRRQREDVRHIHIRTWPCEQHAVPAEDAVSTHDRALEGIRLHERGGGCEDRLRAARHVDARRLRQVLVKEGHIVHHMQRPLFLR